MNKMELTIIVDNKDKDNLACEHGYALHIRTGKSSHLLDTGQSAILQSNAEKLGIDLSALDGVILSHGHYDHSGGLGWLLQKCPDLPLYLHSKAQLDRYSLDEDRAKPVHISRDTRKIIAEHGADKVHQISQPTEIADGIWLTGSVPRLTDFEDSGGDFYFDKEGQEVDIIPDDMSLWRQTDTGLVICLGCCHSGLINTLNHIMKVSGESNIDTIIGGMHLLNANTDRLEKTVTHLSHMDIKRIITCHCSGDEASAYLARHLAIPVESGYTGLSLSF